MRGALRERKLIAAYGVDHPTSTAFELNAGAFHAVDPATVAPTAQCAELLDGRFSGRSLFDGYLPREAHREGPPCREPWPGSARIVDPTWGQHFPVLTAG